MSSNQDRWQNDTFAQRRDRIRRRVRLVVAAGIALTAFILTLASGDAAAAIYDQAPGWMRALVFTLAITLGACLARAYVGFEEEATRLDRVVESQPSAGADRAGADWPEVAERWWTAALVLTLLTPLSFLAVTWFAAFR